MTTGHLLTFLLLDDLSVQLIPKAAYSDNAKEPFGQWHGAANVSTRFSSPRAMWQLE